MSPNDSRIDVQRRRVLGPRSGRYADSRGRQWPLERFFLQLCPREQRILTLLAEEWSQQEIADELGISRQRVSQIRQAVATRWRKREKSVRPSAFRPYPKESPNEA